MGTGKIIDHLKDVAFLCILVVLLLTLIFCWLLPLTSSRGLTLQIMELSTTC